MEKLFYSTDDLVELGLFGSKGIIHKNAQTGHSLSPGLSRPVSVSSAMKKIVIIYAVAFAFVAWQVAGVGDG